MLANRQTARIVIIGTVIWFALILGFLIWVAGGEAAYIGSPITTPIGATQGAPMQGTVSTSTGSQTLMSATTTPTP